MKKLSILLGSALVMLTAGCTKDATKDVAPSDKVTVFEMNIEGEADARTVLDGRDVLWSEGDCVAINGQKATVAEEYVGTKSARFEVAGVSDAPYRVIYPAEAYNDDGTITVSEIQEYAPNSFAQGAAVMVGYGETTAIQLQNLYGLVKITIKKEGDERIQSVTLHSNNLEAMTGTFTVDYATAAMTPLAGMDFVKVVSSAGIDYNAEGKAVIYIAVPAGTYAKGFTVKVATDKGTMSRSANSKTGATIERNTIYSMDPFQYAQGKADTVESITTAEQLQAFLNAVNAGDYAAYKASNGEVQLGADIDLKNATTITPATSFDGIFNGRGYKLKNWQSDGTALFAATTAEAVVKNIVIDSSCKMDVSNAAAGNKAFIVASNLGTVSGCTNYADMVFAPADDLAAQYMIGAIVGVSTSATITNCHNKGDFTIALQSMTKSSYYFGGVVGDTAQKSSLTKCINEGNITITIDGTNGWKNVYLGGVSGACNNAGVLSDCINKGKVSFTLDKANTGAYPNVGGVTGYTANTITNCTNYGDVSITVNQAGAKDSVTRPAVGGIAGYVNGDITGCANYGHIQLKASETVKFGATGSYSAGGVGKMGHPVIGGVCGCVGYPKETYKPSSGTATSTTAQVHTISDCHNYGTVELYSPINATWIPIGGVVGLPTGTIEKCANEKSGVVKVIKGGVQTYLGGVYGCTVNATNTITDCANYGKVWFIDSGAVALGKASTRSYAGGISGGYQAGSGNTATDCVNEGEVISASAQTMIVGGLFAAHNGSIAKCTNKGNVTVENATATTTSEIGGIAGYVNADVTDCNSYGTITNNSAAGTDTGALIAAQGGAKAIVGGVIDCQINAEGSNVGFVLGSTRAAKVAVPLGSATAPITIKRTSAINGAQVTDADIAADGKLAGILRTGASITITNVVLE